MSDDTTLDTFSNRGFRYADAVLGVPGYGESQIRVYESSAAIAPRVWIEAKEDDATATIHLELRDALKFAEDIVRVCRNHYQTQKTGEQQ